MRRLSRPKPIGVQLLQLPMRPLNHNPQLHALSNRGDHEATKAAV